VKHIVEIGIGTIKPTTIPTPIKYKKLILEYGVVAVE